jgi:hypothetical protein
MSVAVVYISLTEGSGEIGITYKRIISGAGIIYTKQ